MVEKFVYSNVGESIIKIVLTFCGNIIFIFLIHQITVLNRVCISPYCA